MEHSDPNNPIDTIHQKLKLEKAVELINSRRPVLTSNIHRPHSGSVFLFDPTAVSHFRYDGYDWEKTKNGNRVCEIHTTLKLKDRSDIELICYSARKKDNKNFRRRCYWIRNSKSIVLVHYLQEEGNTRTNSESGSKVAPNSEIDELSPPATEKPDVNSGNIQDLHHGDEFESPDEQFFSRVNEMMDNFKFCDFVPDEWILADGHTNQQPFGNTESTACLTKGKEIEPTVVQDETIISTPYVSPSTMPVNGATPLPPAKKHKSKRSAAKNHDDDSNEVPKVLKEFTAEVIEQLKASTSSIVKGLEDGKKLILAELGKMSLPQ